MACSCQGIGTKVECTLLPLGRIVLGEQPWGRAVRASQNSREFGALLICGRVFEFTRSSVFSKVSREGLGWDLLPPRPCRSPHERGARAHIFCTKPCTLHRLCLGYDVPPCDPPNPEIRVWSGGCNAGMRASREGDLVPG